MEIYKKRPITVSVVLVILLLLSLSVVVNVVYLVVAMYFSFGNVAVLVLMLLWALILLWLFRAVLQRKTYGRYLTILLLAFLWVMVFRNLILFFTGQPGFVLEARSDLEWLGTWALYVFQFVSFLPLAIVFAVSKPVSAYFGEGIDANERCLPPPPPTFDD